MVAWCARTYKACSHGYPFKNTRPARGNYSHGASPYRIEHECRRPRWRRARARACMSLHYGRAMLAVRACAEGILREGPCREGASWAVCGSGAPPYNFLNFYSMVFVTAGFAPETAEKRLDPKSLKGQTSFLDLSGLFWTCPKNPHLGLYDPGCMM